MRALIFDFDGVVVDTESPELQSYQELYARYGVRFPVEQWVGSVGGALTFDAYEHLRAAVRKRLNIREAREWRRGRHRELVFQESLCAGVREYLEDAQARGLKVALASSSRAGWVMPLLRHHRLDAYFQTIVTADQVERVKPDPALYRSALVALGVGARDAVAIEDSVNGLRAAKSAGVACVVVTNAVTEKLDWPPDLEDMRLESLQELSLDELLSALEKMRSSSAGRGGLR